MALQMSIMKYQTSSTVCIISLCLVHIDGILFGPIGATFFEPGKCNSISSGITASSKLY